VSGSCMASLQSCSHAFEHVFSHHTLLFSFVFMRFFFLGGGQNLYVAQGGLELAV
jgi:hypothetical protein